MTTPTLEALEAEARGMLTGWVYVNGGLGGLQKGSGLYKTDCVYATWRCFREIGMAGHWSVQPKTVPKLVSACNFPHGAPGSQQRGDILIHDDGHGNLHAGICLVNAQTEFSALNEHAGVVIGRIAQSPPFTLVLHTGLSPAPMPPVQPYQPREGDDMIPCKTTRLYDSRVKGRSVVGTNGGRLKARTLRRFQIAGKGPVPADAVAVILAIATVDPTAKGGWLNLSLETGVPDAISTLNLGAPGDPPVDGFPTLGLDATGGLTAYSTVDVDLILQVTGWYPPAVPVTPA